MKVYVPHKVGGKWRMYMGTVEEVIVQKDRGTHEMRGAIVQWEDPDERDIERLPYPAARLRVSPRGQEMEIQGQFVQEQELQEPEGEEVFSGRKSKKKR